MKNLFFSSTRKAYTTTAPRGSVHDKAAREMHRSAAKKYLVALRAGTPDHKLYMLWLREALTKGNLTLKSIGTTKHELEALTQKGCEKAAHEWLDYLREGATNYKACVDWLHKEMHEGNLTLNRLGTSSAELAYCKRKSALRNAA